MNTTERAIKIATLRKRLADLKADERRLLDELERCRWHAESTVKELSDLGVMDFREPKS